MGQIVTMAFICYHCQEESLRTIELSRIQMEPYKFRTDGHCVNSSMLKDPVMWCRNCEKFVVCSQLNDGEMHNERGNIKNGSKILKLLDAKKLLYPDSKARREIDDEISYIMLSSRPNSLPTFHRVDTPRKLEFAVKSDELAQEPEILHWLRIKYWQLQNSDQCYFERKDMPSIYSTLLQTWDGKTDESYVYKIEMLRNLSCFDESLQLIHYPPNDCMDIMEKHKKRVSIIEALNKVKVREVVEIND